MKYSDIIWLKGTHWIGLLQKEANMSVLFSVLDGFCLKSPPSFSYCGPKLWMLWTESPLLPESPLRLVKISGIATCDRESSSNKKGRTGHPIIPEATTWYSTRSKSSDAFTSPCNHRWKLTDRLEQNYSNLCCFRFPHLAFNCWQQKRV